MCSTMSDLFNGTNGKNAKEMLLFSTVSIAELAEPTKQSNALQIFGLAIKNAWDPNTVLVQGTAKPRYQLFEC